MAGKYKDITNQTFNRLTAIKPIGPNKWGGYIWLFKCSCGKLKEIYASPIILGKVKSCGCLNSENAKIKAKKMGLNTNKGFEVSATNTKYNSYKNDALKRSYDFKLTFDCFKKLIKQNCFYCNLEPQLTRTNGKTPITMNGLDRIDNSKGYIESNTVSCCKTCNSSKHAVSLSMIKKIYECLHLESYKHEI